MTLIENTLAALDVGAPVAFANLTMFPLLGAQPGEPHYLTLGEALATRQVRITEVSELGSVPELRVANTADRPLLLLDGEELVGAKQNRIVNLTILVAAHSELVIPVSCVEAGRWRHESASFAAAERALFARGRAQKTAQVSESMQRSGQRRSDQGAVWEEIRSKSERMRAHSDTAAAAALYETNATRLDDYIAAMPAAPGQCGAVFAINGQIVGVDLFDAGATYAKQSHKLLSSYALDAIDELRGEVPAAPPEQCAAFLAEVRQAACTAFKAVGEGEDLRLAGECVKGAALTLDARVLHLCAFRVEAGGATADGGATDAERGRMLRASRRRNLRARM